MTGRRARIAAIIALILLLAAGFVPGCSRSESASASILQVLAASSLTEAFRDIERDFEAIHPNVDVELSFAGSQVLRLQLEQGAYADLFASANQKHMEALLKARLVLKSEVMARNQLVLIVPSSNRSTIRSFRDLPRSSRLVIGTKNVPVGIYTRKLFENARSLLGNDFVTQVLERVVSEEVNVRLIRAKVELGEADAAIVYRTDAMASRGVRSVAIPDEINPLATYYIGQVASSKRPKLGRAFLDFVRSDQGRRILARRGFLTETTVFK